MTDILFGINKALAADDCSKRLVWIAIDYLTFPSSGRRVLV